MEIPIWEQAKENSAPLERGRNVALLEQSAVATEEDRRELERMLRHYEKLVQQEDDDALIHWLSYIKFHQESFPADTHEQFLLLERCFRALCPVRKYANDLRFIRVCCRYAEQTKRPREIFQYLYQQNIGAQVAIFWAAWAFVAEKEQDYAFADKIFNKGLSKKAAPLNYLQQRHKQFQRRMSRYWLNSTSNQDPDDDNDDQDGRGVLGGLSEESFRRNDRRAASRPNSLRNPRMPATSATFATRGTSARATLQRQDENQPFAIYTEHTQPDNEALNDSLIEPDGRVLETEEDRLKENTILPERWNERGALSTSHIFSTTPILCAPKQPVAFAVYVDEECAAQHQREQVDKRRAVERHRQVRDERTFKERGVDSVAERLTNDPLRYVRDPSQVQSDQPVRPEAPSQLKSRGFDKMLLKSPSGAEQCFEEARGQASYFKLVSSCSNVNLFATSCIDEQNNSNMSMDESTNTSYHSISIQSACATSVGAPQAVALTPGLQNRPVDPNVTTDSATSSVAAGGVADPTINTQLALRELSMMFSSPAFPLMERSRIEDRSGGLGPILNESGVSDACNTSVIIQQEEVLADCDPDSSLLVAKEPMAGFAIFTDVEHDDVPPADCATAVKVPLKSATVFKIYTDTPEADAGVEPAEVPVRKDTLKPSQTFEIFMDDLQPDPSRMLSRDTANRELHVDRKKRSGVLEHIDERSDDSNSCDEEKDGDTATFSLFNEVVQMLDDVSIGGNSDDCNGKNSTDLTKICSQSTHHPVLNAKSMISDYASVYQDLIKSSTHHLKGNASSHFPKIPALTRVLSEPQTIYDLQEHALPRPLKQQQVNQGVEIRISHSSAKIVTELGRGSFGSVALLESETTEKIAIKSQAPIDCLALEFDLLQTAKKRIGTRNLFFPDPLSLIFFADGALLAMSAVTTSGLNLIDLVNAYTLHDESVPEIVVLYYTSLMLLYIEILHWKAKILHCDVKPDNWVLSQSHTMAGDSVVGTDLCLIDFGRGIDLAKHEGRAVSLSDKNVMNKRFIGPSCVEEMMCVAMRRGLPWSFDADTFGICACVHVLLFSSHIELKEDKNGDWVPIEPLEGLTYATFWDEMFRTLLNLDPETQVAIGSRPHSLREMRKKIDNEWKDDIVLQRELRRQATLLPSTRDILKERK